MSKVSPAEIEEVGLRDMPKIINKTNKLYLMCLLKKNLNIIVLGNPPIYNHLQIEALCDCGYSP